MTAKCYHFFKLAFAILFLANQSFASSLLLKDSDLKNYLGSDAPDFDAIELQTSKIEEQSSLFSDQYAPIVFAETQVAESDDPRNSEWVKQQTIGVKKKFDFGVQSDLSYIYRNEKFSSFIPFPYTGIEVYAPIINLGVEVDLWKNFLGHLEKSQYDFIRQNIHQSEIKKRIDAKSFHLSLRILYWRLAAQERRVEIFSELVESSRRAYREMQSRLRDNVADAGNVANMAANLSNAEANQRAAIIQKNFIERELKSRIPKLHDFDIRVADGYKQIRSTVLKCVACAQSVGQIRDIPYQFTEHDELIASFDGAFAAKERELATHSDLDVKLKLNAQSFGLDPDSGEAISQPFGAEKTAYTATLTFAMPLGSVTKTERLLISNEKRQTNIQKSRLEADFKAAHQNLQRNFGPLEQAVKLYHQSINQQVKAFKNTVIKFQQGRISVIDYITDQNSVLSSKLEVLRVEEQIITEMLKYYMTFNLAPCEFNRI